ncbi:MAG: pirin family protein [Propionibacterium sp.]|nr:pirin family protein [Propionibacterium sp.]
MGAVNKVVVKQPYRASLGAVSPTQVGRLIPQRGLVMIGGWCLFDHFGPDARPLRVAGHPHTGLQTLTWLFEGELCHRDSLGTDELIHPGEVGLLTAGWGATQTEYSTPGPLHGIQLWAALPADARFTAPHFELFATEPVRMGDHELAVFIGEFGDAESPVEVYSPLCAAEIRFTTDDPLIIDLPKSWEFGVLADTGTVQVNDTKVSAGSLGYVAAGQQKLRLQAHANAGEVVRAVVIGGEPFGEDIVGWWNFVGRSHEEIMAWRANWQAGIGAEAGGDNPNNFPMTRRTDDEKEIEAPPMPPVRLRPRR